MIADDRLIYLLFKAQHRLQAHLRSELSAAGIRITPVQSGILFLLKQKNGRTMTELSQFLLTDNSAITGLADRLEKAGLVVRKADPDDRRVNLIYITPEGVEEVDKAKAVIKRVNEEIKADFSDGEMEIFKKVLSGLLVKFGKD